MADTAKNWTDNTPEEELSPNTAALYIFLIYTPALILLSWALEVAVDGPARELAGEVEREVRRERGWWRKGRRKTCCEFIWTNWKIWSLIIWLLAVFIVTEVFGLIDPEARDRVYSEGVPQPSER